MSNDTHSWRDDETMTTPPDADLPPRASILGDLSEGDSFILTFHDDGELVQRPHGPQVAFNVTVDAIPDGVEDWDDEPVESGWEGVFETGSRKLLSILSDLELEGLAYTVTVDELNDTNAEYTVEPVDD